MVGFEQIAIQTPLVLTVAEREYSKPAFYLMNRGIRGFEQRPSVFENGHELNAAHRELSGSDSRVRITDPRAHSTYPLYGVSHDVSGL